MANELNIVYASGSTLYAVLLDSTGDIYNGSAFETPLAANWATYDIALTEASTTGVYRGTMPGVSAGVYYVIAYLQAGGGPATTDNTIGDGKIEWDGSAEIPVNTILADTNELQGDWADGGRLDLILDARASQTTADAIETDTQNIQSRLPAALVGGAMDSDVSAIQTGAITAASIATDAIGAAELAADAVAEIADAVWDEAKSGHVGVGSFGEEVQSHALSSEISALNDLSAAEVNTEVDTALVDIGLDHLVSASVVGADVTDNSIVAKMVSKGVTADWDSYINTTDALEATADAISGLNDPTAATVAGAVWDEAKSGHVGVGSFGEEVQSHALSSEISALNDLSAAQVNAEVDTALADYDGPTNAEMEARTLPTATYFDPTADTVTVGTNNDKTGYALSAAGVDGILDDPTDGSYTLRQLLRLMAAVLAGKVSGATTTTITFRDLNDGKNRVVATVDADGNRTDVSFDAT